MSKIAACLIVKDAEQTLEACLASIRPFVDGVFIYDTGSTDGTLALLQKLNETTEIDAVAGDEKFKAPLAPIVVEQGEWRNDFAWAREQSFAMPDESFDWLIWLDDDDVIHGAQHLRGLAAGASEDCNGFIFMYDYARDEHGNCVCQLWRERLIRRSAGFRWVSPVHEVLLAPEGVPPAFLQVPADQVLYVHHRDQAPAGRYAPDRNIQILLAQKEKLEQAGELPEPRMLAYLGTEYMARGQFADAIPYLQGYLDHPATVWPDERAQVHHKLGNCLRMLGNPTATVEVEMRALRERDDWPENLVGLAGAFAALNQWPRVEWWARLAVARAEANQHAHGTPLPRSPLILNPLEHLFLPLMLIADACIHQERFDDAKAAAVKAAAIAPDMIGSKIAEIDHAASTAEIVGAVLLLREVLVRHDENLKAWNLLQQVPYPVADHPKIVEARLSQREMVAHALEPAEYIRWYRDEPKESTVPDEAVDTIDEYIDRARYLLEGLQEQEAELGRKPVVLDLGCNDFWMSCFLWRKGEIRCDGIELNQASYEKGKGRKTRFGTPGVIKQGDLHDAPNLFKRRYDAVSLFEVLEHVPDVDATLDLLESLVKPGGRVYLTTPNGAFERGNIQEWEKVERKGHLRAMPAHELAETLITRGTVHDFRVHHQDGRLTFAGYEPRARAGTVTFFAGGSWEPWSPASLRQGGIGGSETALVQVATRLAKQGHAVKVYSGAEPGLFGGVLYRPFSAWDPSEPVDLFVSSRRPDVFDLEINAKRTALWCHDHSYPGMMTEQRAAKIDDIVVLSEWERDRFARLYPYTEDRLRIIRNGITVFEQDGSPRYAHANRSFGRRKPRTVYSSSADRGLDVLLEVWPLIREQVPDAELHVFYGWDTFDRVAQTSPHLWSLKAGILSLAEQAGGEDGGVFFRGRVGQVELAEEMQQARVLAYPTAFLETSCITAMEARAAGLPIVTSELGGLQESAAGQTLIAWSDDEDEPVNRLSSYQDAFVDEVVAMLTERQRWEFFHSAALDGVNKLDWEHRAAEWAALLDPSAPPEVKPKRERVAA